MPRTLKEFRFRGRGRTSKTEYHWPEWLDGNPRTFVQGDDFVVSPANFVSAAFHAAKRMGLQIRTNKLSPTSVVIQSYKAPRKRAKKK